MASRKTKFGALAGGAALVGGSLLFAAQGGKGPKPTTTTSVAQTTTTAAPTTTTTAAGTRRTFYVDALAGSDSNTGTSTTAAWRTLGKATAAVLGPSDWLLLKRGSVWNQQLRIDESGTSAQPIEVGAYGTGNDPVIDGGGTVSTCLLLNGSYLWVSKLRLQNCSWAGVDVYGDRNIVTESYITGNAAGIVLRESGTFNQILRNQVIDNKRMSVLTPTSVNPDDDSGAFGLLIQGDDNEIAFNTVSGHYAFSYDYGQDGGAFEVYGGQRNRIHRNLAIDNDAFTELGSSRSADNKFYYNVVRGSLAGQIFVNTRGAESGWGPVTNTIVENNSVYLPGPSSQGVLCYSTCSPQLLTMRNNIIYTTYKVGSMDGPCTCSHNVFFGSQIQFTKALTDLVADPLFVSTTDLHLRAGSPAINSGTPLSYYLDFDNLPYVGTVDRGAYEYR